MKAFVIFAALSVCAYAVSADEVARSYQRREDRNIPVSKDLHIPNYKFEYGVKDPKTGDHKAAWEVRNGGYVKGGYMLDDADGCVRVVEYEADPKNGFRATVKRISKGFHPRRLNRVPPPTPEIIVADSEEVVVNEAVEPRQEQEPEPEKEIPDEPEAVEEIQPPVFEGESPDDMYY